MSAIALLSVLPGLVLLSVVVAMLAPRGEYAENIGILAPSAYLAFLVVSIIGPISAGGGNELYPPTQLVAFPIRPVSVFHASLTLMPLNIAWLTNAVGLIGITVYIVEPGAYSALALITAVAFVIMATLLGAVVAWWVVGLRQSTAGRRMVTVVGVGLAVAAATIVGTGNTTDVLDKIPTRSIVFGLVFAARGNEEPWIRRMSLLLLVTVAAYAAARWCCAWALRRPATTRGVKDGTRRHPTRSSRSAFGQVLSLDRASVWRSSSLRRGLIILAAAPGALAAALSLRWSEILLLPGLAAAGAGLLFGVNAFCLHGSGLVWLASQPHSLRLALASKVVVTAEICGVAVLSTVVAAAVRASSPPSLREAVIVSIWCPLVVAVVVAICLHLSVTRPHRADFSGDRDVPAPPGAMALYSVRLAIVTTTLSLIVSVFARVGTPLFLSSAAFVLAAFCALSIAMTAAKWNNREIQAAVVTTVAAG